MILEAVRIKSKYVLSNFTNGTKAKWKIRSRDSACRKMNLEVKEEKSGWTISGGEFWIKKECFVFYGLEWTWSNTIHRYIGIMGHRRFLRNGRRWNSSPRAGSHLWLEEGRNTYSSLSLNVVSLTKWSKRRGQFEGCVQMGFTMNRREGT